MSTFYTVLLGMAGLIIGLVGTFVGIGGGILLLLLFIFLFVANGYDTYETVRLCIANTVVVLAAMHLVTFGRKLFDRQLHLRDSIVVMLPTLIIGGCLTYALLHYELLSTNIYRIILICFIGYTSIVLLVNSKQRMFQVCHKGGVQGNLRNLFAGSLSGLFTGLLGVESGTFIVPILNRYCHIDIRRAVAIYGTSFLPLLLLMVGMYAFPDQQMPGSEFTGYIYWPYALPLLIGAFLSSFVGYELFNRFQFQYFVYPLVFVFTLTAIRMLFSDILYPLYR